jgi:hypothetical protein
MVISARAPRMHPRKHPAGTARMMMIDMVVITPSLWTNDSYHDGMKSATPKYRETEKMSEVKGPEPFGKEHPRVARALDVITSELMAIHEKDRAHVIEGLNKFGLLSGGVSKLEKEQQKQHDDAVKHSEEWVEKVKKEGLMPAAPAEPKKETKK